MAESLSLQLQLLLSYFFTSLRQGVSGLWTQQIAERDEVPSIIPPIIIKIRMAAVITRGAILSFGGGP